MVSDPKPVGKYLIGVDGGTQSSKVVVYDLEGNVVCQGRQPLRPFSRPQPGIVEHPDDDCWTSIAAASREAMTAFPGDPSDILGVGLCTIRCCKAFLKADGTLLQPLLSWMDVRAYEPYVPDNPELAYATTSSGYMTHRFTGEFRDSAANNIILQWPIDTDAWQWDPALFPRFNMRPELLMELLMPGDVAGHVTPECAAATGIPEGLPVVTTANDKAVEALGTGTLGERTALISLGTYIASMVHGHENRKDPVEFWTNFACVPHKYLYESHGIRRGMWTLSWFLDLLGPEMAAAAAAEGLSREQYLEREAEPTPPGSDGLLTVLDWLAPTDHPYRKGVMLGWDARHTRGHVYRSILEAIALTMKTRVDAMARELGVTFDDIVVSGGGASSPLFMQIFSDVFGVPAHRTIGASGASLGAAICAAVATGVHSDFETAAAHMAGGRETFQPDLANTATYTRLLADVYTRIRAATDPILERSFPIFR
ncbi:MAG TPA: FGGY-family carbohydrate kinase [Thermoleophilia bacterium]|nr:FGGY-family carbohydrate kinase [Thermoleophilia bacterium]